MNLIKWIRFGSCEVRRRGLSDSQSREEALSAGNWITSKNSLRGIAMGRGPILKINSLHLILSYFERLFKTASISLAI